MKLRFKIAAVSVLLGAGLAGAFVFFKPCLCHSATTSIGTAGSAVDKTVAPFYDPEMARGCEMSCAFQGHYDESTVVKQPGARVGDLVHCPVSGVIFRVTQDSPKIVYQGHQYFTCCKTCAKKFGQAHG